MISNEYLTKVRAYYNDKDSIDTDMFNRNVYTSSRRFFISIAFPDDSCEHNMNFDGTKTIIESEHLSTGIVRLHAYHLQFYSNLDESLHTLLSKQEEDNWISGYIRF